MLESHQGAAGRRAPHDAGGPGLLCAPVTSDHLSYLKLGAPADRGSMAALYRTDGRGDAAVVPSPELDGFLTVIMLEPHEGFTLRRNGKAIRISPPPAGSISIHDLRNRWSRDRSAMFTLNLVFSASFLEEMQPQRGPHAAGGLQERVDYNGADGTLLHLALALLPQFENPQAADRLFVDQVILAASTHLLGRYGSPVPPAAGPGRLSARQERLAKEFLLAHLHGDVALSEAAHACGLSAAYFARAFKRTTGLPPYRWLQLQRVDLAKRLLRSTAEPLSAIATTCGFADQSHFTRTFTRLAGGSPGAWRRLRRP